MPESAPDRTLIAAISSALIQAIEGMTGERPTVGVAAAEGAATAPEDCAWWSQSFSFAPGAHVHVGAPESSWSEIGNSILKAAGIDDGDRESIRSTFTEILSQTFGGVARTLSGRLGKQVTTSADEQSGSGAAPSGRTFELNVSWSAIGPLLVLVSMEAPLLAGLEASMDGAGRPEVPTAAAEPARNAGGAGLDEDAIRRSRKMDLLLDVELPVSVSFGRAQLLLKDVIKLTTGSIIELNRSISEPVDVIVNNCVIARGEVVVVEGNFGVRVHEVVSRQERLRTLK
ncbi:MAG: flagellar motor switch protein FliN [Bryobacteraceae bacterium]|jgi:flagellar motor switch protein FliN/FliY